MRSLTSQIRPLAYIENYNETIGILAFRSGFVQEVYWVGNRIIQQEPLNNQSNGYLKSRHFNI